MELSNILKVSTKRIHQSVEKTVVLRIKTIQSDNDYIELLKYFYAYFEAVEKAAQPYVNERILPDYQERRNASHLANDIAELGGSLNSLPIPNPPKIGNSLQAMSALYVLEGSIIGGPHIITMLKKTGITKGFSFFSGYGEKGEEKWTTFLVSLKALCQNDADKIKSLKTAVETFRYFGDIFQQPLKKKNMQSEKT